MNKIALCMAAAATVAAAAAPAVAQNYYGNNGNYGYGNNWNNGRNNNWMSIDQRQAMLDRRIDQGVRSGQLTRAEARTLRNEFRDIARLEVRYRRDGLQNWERADLDARFDRLSYRVQAERRDYDRRYSYNYR